MIFLKTHIKSIAISKLFWPHSRTTKQWSLPHYILLFMCSKIQKHGIRKSKNSYSNVNKSEVFISRIKSLISTISCIFTKKLNLKEIFEISKWQPKKTSLNWSYYLSCAVRFKSSEHGKWFQKKFSNVNKS